jgi:hypothetical protein
VQTTDSHVSILRKPFQLPQLDKAIREALQRAGRDNNGDRVLQFARRNASKRE